MGRRSNYWQAKNRQSVVPPVQSELDGDSETRVVGPRWLGSGPIKGNTVPLARAGTKRAQGVVLQVLEAARVMVHSGEVASAGRSM